MIRIFTGNVGSGKTADAVMEMAQKQRLTYTNIATKLKNCHDLKPENIINRTEVGQKKTKGSDIVQPIYKMSLNVDFWKNIPKPCDVVLDECHSILSSRRSMSNTNRIISEWLSMLRRALNESGSRTGHLTLITQRYMSIDENARNLATQIRHHVCHWITRCPRCLFQFEESSQMPEIAEECPACLSEKITRTGHMIEILKFDSEESYLAWKIDGTDTAYDHYQINNISRYFPMYNTLQWDNLFNGYY